MQRAVFFIVFAALVIQVLGHSYLTNPITRTNQKQTTTGCRGPACLGPCDAPLSKAKRAPITIARGDTISAQWPRNNHAGGFIRFAWAPTAQSDSHAAFDAGTVQVNCHEVGACSPDSKSDPNGGDSGPADGSSRACASRITVPTHLPDGKYTLQWAWFGGAYQLGDYYSCVDYTISGGPTAPRAAAVFIGGDYTYPGQNKCKFFNTDRLHQCVDEPCDNPIYKSAREQSGPAYMASYYNGTSSSPSTPSTPPSSPAAPPAATSTSTTRKSSTSTSTTRKSSTTTTGKSSTTTTGKSSTSTSSSGSAPVPTPSDDGACTLGHMKCTSKGSSTYHTCSWVTRDATGWSVAQKCPTGLTCSESGDYIYCL